MSIVKIKQLRTEKLKKVNHHKSEIDKIKNDERLSDQYKREAIKQHEEELNITTQNFDKQINELIQNGKQELQRKIISAEFEGISNENLMRKFLIENRNRDITARAMDQYKDNSNKLYKIVEQEVNNNSLTAPGYINAYLRIVEDPVLRNAVEQMEQEYKNNTMNALQKDYSRELEQYLEQEQEYNNELGNDAFSQVMMKYQ